MSLGNLFEYIRHMFIDSKKNILFDFKFWFVKISKAMPINLYSFYVYHNFSLVYKSNLNNLSIIFIAKKIIKKI